MIFREAKIGDCHLILGDCISQIDQIKADCVVTDPPYGMNYRSRYATDALWGADRKIRGDADLLLRDRIADWSHPRPTLMFGTWKVPRPSNTRQVLIWDKGGALGMGALDIPWKPDHEEIYVLGHGFIGRRDSGSVIKCPPVQSMAKNGRLHPTEKPIALMQALIAKVPGTIFDPFMGSGTTLVAAAMQRRPAIGIEIMESHFETACRRVEEAYRQPFFKIEPGPAQKQGGLDL